MIQAGQYELVARMLFWLVENRTIQPKLEDLAEQFGLNPHHLQRTFRKFAGVSPKQFLKFLTKEQAVARLKAGSTVFDASLDCGLSGPGRLHDLMISTQALTPGEARRQADGVRIEYGFSRSPFGDSLIGWTRRGLCFLGFCQAMSEKQALRELFEQWPRARYEANSAGARRLAAEVFDREPGKPLAVWLQGTPFQLSVWQALLKIPPGLHCTYGQIAQTLGKPGAARAVGTAIGANPVSLLIPCHRVITHVAGWGGYRWGVATKQAIVAWEAAQAGVAERAE